MTTTLLTTKDMARHLGVSVRAVQALIARGRLPAQRLGRDWVIREEDAASFLPRPRGRPPKGSTH